MPQYSGIWTEQAVMQAVGAGNWPGNPGAPTIGTATGGNASASVTFTAPTDNGGSAITGYTVTSSPGGLTGTGASSPITVSGLTNGTAYTFTVRATNATGTGPASAASNSVTPAEPVYIEEVYSAYLYTGNGSTQTITNGIDLAGKGGLAWVKGRSNTANNVLNWNTSGGSSTAFAQSNSTWGGSNNITAFLNNGFTVTTDYGTDGVTSGRTYSTWTFRKQPKFFDVVTYTGTGGTQTLNHSLGSVPGCLIMKSTSTSNEWVVNHRSLTVGDSIFLNQTYAASAGSSFLQDATSTTFKVPSYCNANGDTYVAYLFAHNAGGFGLNGTDNVISCGSYTGNGSTTGPVITLGYEPQWLMVKKSSGTGDWVIVDNMRGIVTGGVDPRLWANLSSAENTGDWLFQLNATGFQPESLSDSINASGQTYIYIAIRRGPMKTPTLGTSVFKPTVGLDGTSPISTGFPVDMFFDAERSGSAINTSVGSRLTGNQKGLITSSTSAELDTIGASVCWTNNTGYTPFVFGSSTGVQYAFKRAPSFFDEVCYTGTGSNATVKHNLTVRPEVIITKRRDAARNWAYYTNLGATAYTAAVLNDTYAPGATPAAYDTALTAQPSSTEFYVGTSFDCNASGGTYVAYLFATCAGVSKVGSYTGTGALQTVNCGFAAGARFVLIKRTDSTGDWYTYDSARGITSSNDPYLLLNSTAAEVTGTNYVDTTSVGFQVTAAAPAGLNASGGTYIFLAIA